MKTTIHPTKGSPVVTAHLDAGAKCILLFYDHYDVPPAEPFDLWDSPPFEPEIRNGRLKTQSNNRSMGSIVTFMHRSSKYEKLGFVATPSSLTHSQHIQRKGSSGKRKNLDSL